jgi:hypothetical protein
LMLLPQMNVEAVEPLGHASLLTLLCHLILTILLVLYVRSQPFLLLSTMITYQYL